MKRLLLTLGAGLLLAAAPLIAQDAPSIADDFKTIDEHTKNPPKIRTQGQTWLEKGKELCKGFCERWEGKAKGEEHFYIAKAYMSLSQFDRGNSTEYFKKAKTHCDETLKAKPDHAEAKDLGGRLDNLVKQIEIRAASDKKREELVGKPAPAIEADEVLDGKQMTLESLKGKVVLLDFWATWCRPCLAVIPHIVELQKRHKDAGLVVLGMTRFYTYGFIPGESPNKGESKQDLSPDAERDVNRECAKKLGINYPIVFSTKANANYFVSGIPQLAVIDRKGVVRFVKVGAGKPEEISKIVEQCLAEPAEKGK